jgi:hypothetical protein
MPARLVCVCLTVVDVVIVARKLAHGVSPRALCALCGDVCYAPTRARLLLRLIFVRRPPAVRARTHSACRTFKAGTTLTIGSGHDCSKRLFNVFCNNGTRAYTHIQNQFDPFVCVGKHELVMIPMRKHGRVRNLARPLHTLFVCVTRDDSGFWAVLVLERSFF